jgi:hypothetical protein
MLSAIADVGLGFKVAGKRLSASVKVMRYSPETDGAIPEIA